MNAVVHLITTICMGGAEKQLLTLIDEQVKSGRKVSVVYLKGMPELESAISQTGADLVKSFSNKNPLIQAFKIRRMLSKKKDSIVHAHLPRAELLTFFLQRNSNIVLSRHNAEKFFPAAPKLISRILSNLVVFRANQVIAISEAVKNYLIESKEIRNHSKIKVIYYGFETRGNTSDLIEEKIRDLDNFDFLIGTIARLVPQKDLETLLTAFSIFSNQESSARLVIVGDGYLKESLIEYASKIGIANKVIWLGRVGNIQAVIRKMKVFALTSIYEGFGLVLLEAMAEGVPIAAANNSAIPEVLGEGYEGLFETGNALMLAKRLFEVSEPKKAQELVKYLNYRIKKFEPNRMRLKIDEIYAELERI